MLLAKEANMSLTVQCSGDLWVDDHHTSEDVAIAVGQVLTKALGSKAGLNRMWCAQGKSGGRSTGYPSRGDRILTMEGYRFSSHTLFSFCV